MVGDDVNFTKLTSHKQHFGFSAHSLWGRVSKEWRQHGNMSVKVLAYLDLIVLLIFIIYHIDGLLNVTKHEVAMAIVGLK